MTITRLSALDAGFLYAERPDFPMHVGALAVLEGGPLFDGDRFRLDELRTTLAARLHVLPRLRQRAVVPFPGCRPVWADDPDFDIRRHVVAVELDPPGDEAQLLDLVARLHTDRLDRAHPLWQIMFITGLEHGRVGLIEKMHHAMVDGLAGVDVASVLMDLSPDGVAIVPNGDHGDAPPPYWGLAIGAVLEQLGRPVVAARAVVGALRHPARSVATARRLGTATSGQPGGLLAPRCSLNERVGPGRRYAIVRHSLEDAKATASQLGGTVNDVVLAATAQGLRRLLEGRGELGRVPSVQAFVPVSLRGRTGERLGNQVAGMLVPLAVAEADVVARFEAIAATTRALKEAGSADVLAGLAGVADVLPEPLVVLTALGVHRQPFTNVVITNVPGPPVPLYAMGARMLETFPIIPLDRNLCVSIGVLSYAGQLNTGLTADAGWVPDLDVLARGIEEGYWELTAATRGQLVPRPELV
jgi:WS/DGAT/MGAT family acyltransferase